MRIKICGITRPADAELAGRLGADAIGINLYERSPRFVTEAQGRAIICALPPLIETVGVVVWSVAGFYPDSVQSLRLRTLQLHGPSGPDPDTKAETVVKDFPSILAHGVRGPADLTELSDRVREWAKHGLKPIAVLADARVEGMQGGTGRTAPWHLLAGYDPGVPLILAGGLTPENVAEAIRIVRPYAVDVASGVESAPGVKDPEKLRRFIGEARNSAAKHGR